MGIHKFEFDVKGLNVLITGGSSGIGLQVSKTFLSKGANVINWDICESEDVNSLKESYFNNYLYYRIDITDENSVKEAAENYAPERVDVLVNNAGIILKSPLEKIETKDWNRIYDINVLGTMLVTKNIVPKMKGSGRGRIINISSMTSKIGLETYSLYSSTKAAVSNLTKVWALELANDGITVNALCPGWVDTPMKEKLIEGISKIHNLNHDEAADAILNHVPQKGFIQTEEIAFTCLFLASTLSKGISGQDLFIDNGLTNMFKPEFHLKGKKVE